MNAIFILGEIISLNHVLRIVPSYFSELPEPVPVGQNAPPRRNYAMICIHFYSNQRESMVKLKEWTPQDTPEAAAERAQRILAEAYLNAK